MTWFKHYLALGRKVGAARSKTRLIYKAVAAGLVGSVAAQAHEAVTASDSVDLVAIATDDFSTDDLVWSGTEPAHDKLDPFHPLSIMAPAEDDAISIELAQTYYGGGSDDRPGRLEALDQVPGGKPRKLRKRKSNITLDNGIKQRGQVQTQGAQPGRPNKKIRKNKRNRQ